MADVTGTGGNDLLTFNGVVQQLTMTITNAYSGKTLIIDDEFNVNTSSYEGLTGIDTLLMSNRGDAIFLTNDVGVQMVFNIETIVAGAGGDVIKLDDATITLGDMTIDGGAADDILWANAGNDIIRGLTGNDIIDGGPGNDNAQGGGDNDTINGGAGADWLQGGDGNDTLEYWVDGVWASGYSTFNLYSGEEAVLTGLNQTHDTFHGGNGADVITMTDGNDALVLDDPVSPRHASTSGARVTGVEMVNAGAGDDVVNFSSAAYAYGDVTVNGGDGDDVIWTGAGNDTLSGDAGNDRLHGGAGNDTLHFSGNEDIYDGGAGADILALRNGGDSVTYDGVNIVAIETINGGNGDDTVMLDHAGLYGDVTVNGGAGNDYVYANSGNDALNGGEGDDTLYGNGGNDRIEGGAGNDILYGGDDSWIPAVNHSHDFTGGGVNFPTLTERQDLDAGEEAALGIAAGDLAVDYATTATITFVESGAGYKNSLGFYSISANGTMQAVEMAFAHVKAAMQGQTYEVTLPGAPDTDFGFFIVADGYSHNAGYAGLDFNTGTLSFVYGYNTAGERAATIYDNAADIKLVYTNGGVEQVLNGPVYHTTERGGSLALNPDGKEHVVSGLIAPQGEERALDVSASDFVGNATSVSSNGISLSTATGHLDYKAAGRIGIDTGGDKKVNDGEVMQVRFDHDAQTVIFKLDNISSTSHGIGIDVAVYLDGGATPVMVELDSRDFVRKADAVTFTLDAADFGAGVFITGMDLSSVDNSGMRTDMFWLADIRTYQAADPADDGVLRIGFEDLPCLGDEDYNDVVFDISVAPVTVVGVPGQAGDDVLIGGAGSDTLYGGGGADDFVFTHLNDGVDTVMDFSLAEGDRLNITDILEGYDALTDVLADFVRLTQQGTDVVLEIDADGAGGDFAAAAIINGGLGGVALADLINMGALVTEQSLTV